MLLLLNSLPPPISTYIKLHVWLYGIQKVNESSTQFKLAQIVVLLLQAKCVHRDYQKQKLLYRVCWHQSFVCRSWGLVSASHSFSVCTVLTYFHLITKPKYCTAKHSDWSKCVHKFVRKHCNSFSFAWIKNVRKGGGLNFQVGTVILSCLYINNLTIPKVETQLKKE